MHRTREPLKPLVGQWWKFTRYELKDGYIRPAPDATLSAYDPWSEPPRGADTAYASLANLVPRGWDAGDNGTVSPDTAAAVLAWCQQYGLLGVLLQRIEKVVLQAWTEDAKAILQEWNGTEEERDRYQIRVQFRRNPRGWQPTIKHDLIVEGESPPDDPAGVMLHPIDDSVEMVFEPFGETWARFFPSVPHDQRESYRYPVPLTQKFWALYHEPIEEFIDTAALLEEHLTTLAKDRETVPGFTIRSVDNYALAIHALNEYVETVRWHLQQTPDGMVQRWASPSLFTSLVLMALQDVAGAKRPRICLTCRRLFVSPAYQARYCSVRCRYTMNKRTYRKRAASKSRRRRKSPATRGRRRKSG